MADESTPAATDAGDTTPTDETPVESTPSEQGTPRATDEQAKAEAAKLAKKFKLKFGKQEREVDESTLLAMAQKGWAADEKFQAAASTQKQLQALLTKLKEDPDMVLRQLGVEDPTELYRNRLAEHLKRQMLTPEQRELLDAKAKLAQHEANAKRFQEQQQQAKLEQAKQKYMQQYDQEISQAIEAQGVPKTSRTVARMADLMAKNIKAGHELPVSAIAEIVREEYIDEVKAALGAHKDEKLLDVIGPELLRKIQTMDAKRRKLPSSAPAGSFKAKPPPEGKTIDGDGKAIVSRDEWRKHIEEWSKS
jgi:hypothetical protein